MGLFNTYVLAYGKYSEEYMIMFITQNKSSHNYWFKKYIIEKLEQPGHIYFSLAEQTYSVIQINRNV